ncbi:MAG: HAMP domain-containing histidine kinase [Planctomycetia bacterium]|nr:HAMP domain-containing histidine kinase [Planctomycetia bacterium]
MDATTPQCWIPPLAETVVALAEGQARGDSLPWPQLLRSDPSLGWFFFTHHHDLNIDRSLFHLKQGIDISLFLDTVLDPALAGFADWSKNSAQKAYRQSQYLGTLSEHIAEQLRMDVQMAHCLGQLTQLGALIYSQQEKKIHHEDGNVLTRKLVRRATCPHWLRELLLRLDLPVDVTKGHETERWALLLQTAIGLASKTPQLQNLGKAACQKLTLSWELEQEFALQAFQHATPSSSTMSSDAAKMLIRTLRMVKHQPAATLSFTVKQLELEVEDLHSRLARVQQLDGDRLREQKLTAVAELAAGAGHEINNPLAVISGQAQYLLKGEEDLNRAKALERIIGQTMRIHTLLRDLMLYARPPEPVYKSIAIHKWIKPLIQSMQEHAIGRGVKLELKPIPAKNSMVCDISLASMAVKCLVYNAIEAAPSGGWVRVTTQVQHGRCQVQVEDNGPGVPAPLQDNIFDPFYSGRNAGRGVGLGLSKVWRIAQLHGGEIKLINHPGKPTCFLFEIPMKPVRGIHKQQKRSA